MWFYRSIYSIRPRLPISFASASSFPMPHRAWGGRLYRWLNQSEGLFVRLPAISVTRTPDGVSVARYVQPRRGMPHVFVLTLLGWQDDAIERTRRRRIGNVVRWKEGRWDLFRFFVRYCALCPRGALGDIIFITPGFFFLFFPYSFFFFCSCSFFFVALFPPDTCLLSLICLFSDPLLLYPISLYYSHRTHPR
jgi:hypothetical protein